MKLQPSHYVDKNEREKNYFHRNERRLIIEDLTDMKGHSWFRFTILKIILRYNFMPSNWIV